MILTGFCRLGQDAELRYTPSGDAVLNLSLAFNHGKKGDDGNRPTQWVSAQLWGSRAEALAEYLTKGTGLCVVLEDPHIEMYDRREGGQGAALRARVSSIEFAGSSGDRQQGEQQRQGGQQQTQQRTQGAGQQQRQGGQARNGYADATGRAQPQQQRREPGFDDDL